jgi:hypothetical protein
VCSILSVKSAMSLTLPRYKFNQWNVILPNTRVKLKHIN